MAEVTEAVHRWPASGGANGKGSERRNDFQRYFHGIAKARYVIRKVIRIVDEQAKKAGLDPLEHQALIQSIPPCRALERFHWRQSAPHSRPTACYSNTTKPGVKSLSVC